MTDTDLLRAYVNDDSQAAFAELARRHAGLVYSAARRQVRDPALADDVTQAVFLLLSRKARRLGTGVVLSAWLLRATHFASRTALCASARRRRHERRAAEMAATSRDEARTPTTPHSGSGDADWERVGPALDEAVASLSASLRAALVLRFFEQRDYADVARTLHVAEPAARQRVARAVAQLRASFARRGVIIPAATLESLVTANAVRPAPAGLAAKAGALSAKGASTHGSLAAIVKGTALAMVPLPAKLGVVTVVVAALAVGTATVVQHRSAARSSGSEALAGMPAAIAQPVTALRGRVLSPDGSPVEGAEVLLARASAPAAVFQPVASGGLWVKTGPDGTFEFPAHLDATAVVVRGDAGFAQVLVGDLLRKGDVTVTPWARIMGTLRVGSKPLAGQLVELHVANGSLEQWNVWRVIHETQARTDAAGNFNFRRAIAFPPGIDRALVVRWPDPAVPGGLRSQVVRVKPGQTSHVDIGGTGRPIIGRIADPSGLPRFTGSLLPHAPPTTRPMLEPLNEAFPVAIGADGAFRVEDVPAGTYDLSITSLEQSAEGPIAEVVAWANATVTVPPMPGGRSDKPLDLGPVSIHRNTLLHAGDVAPEFDAIDADGKLIRLADYRGRTLLLHLRLLNEEAGNRWANPADYKAIYDRFGDDARFAFLEVNLDTSGGNGDGKVPWTRVVPRRIATTVPATGPATRTSDESATEIPTVYFNTPGRLVLIGPDGRVLAKNMTSGSAMSKVAAALPRHPATSQDMIVTVEHRVGPASAAASFATVPPPTAERNAARAARITVIEGGIGDSSGGVGVLSDGRFARNEDDPGSNFFFNWGTPEGRLRIDLGSVQPIERVATYSWHRTERGPQVYRLYASDGCAPNFERSPRAGVDPGRCGWTWLADVDTRPAAGPVGGQHAVNVARAGGGSGPLGTFRYFLFVAFPTEQNDAFGHTFFSEIDVIRAAEVKP